MHTSLRFIIALAVVVVFAALTACAPSATPVPTAIPAKPPSAQPTQPPATQPTQPPAAGQPKRNPELVVALDGDLYSTDPQKGGIIAATNYNVTIAEPLVIMGKDGVEGWLLESFKAAPDGTYTWKVRQGIKFSDGTPLNAEAVKFSIERTMDKKNEFEYQAYFVNTTGMKVIDEYTLEVKNKAYDVEFMERMINVSIVSPTAVQKLGDDFKNKPVGSGPYLFESYTKGERIVLKRNENYWRKGEPYFDRLVFRIIPEESVREVELEAGTVHIAMNMSTQFGAAKKAGLPVITTPALGQQMIYFNLKNISDVNVRKAVSYAIDREAIAKNVFGGISEVGSYPMPKAVWAYDPKFEIYKYDVAKAKQLLDQAGWVPGSDGIRAKGGVKLSWDMPTSSIPSRTQASESIAGMLRAIGIEAKLRTMDNLTHTTIVRKGEFDIAYWEWAGSSSDPWSYSGGLHSKYAWNPSQWGDPNLDVYLDKALVSLDRTERKNLYDQWFTAIMNDARLVSIAFKPAVFVSRPDIAGFEVPGGRLFVNAAYKK